MFKKPFLALFLIIFAVNIGYAFIYKIQLRVDARAYDEIAQNLVNNSTYREGLPDSDLTRDGAIHRVGPGYQFFLAGIYYLFGHHLWLVWILQVILYAGSILLIADASAKIFPEILNHKKFFYSLILLFGLWIDMVQLNAMLMSESLSIFLLTVSLYAFYKQFSSGQTLTFWGGSLLGLLLGLLTLVRPIGLLMFIFLGAIVAWWKRKSAYPYLAGLILCFILIQIPWVVRNYLVFNEIIFHNVAGGINLLAGNYPGNHGEFTVNFDFYRQLKATHPSLLDFERAAKEWYINFWLTHPFLAIGILFEKLVLFFSLAKTSGFWFHYFSSIDQLATTLLSVAQNFIIIGGYFLFLVTGAQKLLKKESLPKEYLFLLGLSIVLIAIPVLTVIASRHRVPFEIFAFPILIYAYLELSKLERRPKIVSVVAVFILLSLTTGLDLYLQFGKFTKRIQEINVFKLVI